MYLPEHFRETEAGEIAAVIRDFPLACIVANTPQGLVANHIPLMMTGADMLFGHVAMRNDLHRLIAEGQEVLAVFRGEDGYISPNLYPTKAEHHRHVPTWNYQAVHVHGAIRFLHDDKAKRAAVGKLTKEQEARMNGADGWKMSDAPADYMAAMLEGIVAFSITIRTVLAKSKLSQNREKPDHDGVVAAMEARGLGHLATRMKRRAAGKDGA